MSRTPFSQFSGRIRRLERTRSRIEKAASHEFVKRADVELLYESLLLRGITHFEAFLEDLFCAILLGKAGYPQSRAKVLVPFANARNLYRIVWRNEKYLDWLPYDKTCERAKTYLLGGRPFTLLTDGERSRLKNLHLIRNAIAHRSQHARHEFVRVVIANQQLPPRERTPGSYLRSVHRFDPRATRFEQAMVDLKEICHRLMPGSPQARRGSVRRIEIDEPESAVGPA